MAGPAADHYTTLGVPHDAPLAAIRAAYQRLALQLHPDKSTCGDQAAFQALQQAWQTLRDARLRALYDHELSQAQLRDTVVLHDELQLADMDQQPADGSAGAAAAEQQQASGASWLRSYPCRCGDAYVLMPAELQLAAAARQIILPCRSCSNHILVHLPP